VGIFTHAPSTLDGAGYTWPGVAGNGDSVKAYASVRYGASNQHNVPGKSGLPCLFGANQRNVDVAWISRLMAKAHTTTRWTSFSTPAPAEAKRKSAVKSWSSRRRRRVHARTAGGVRDSRPFVIGPETWYVWQATQTSNGHSWHATQFRKRVNCRSFHHNLKDFFAEAAARRPAIFSRGNYVMMVEAGTEIKTGAGRVALDRYRVTVN
jgi:hypothetical protein